MIRTGVKVFLASEPMDFRKGPDGLLSLVRDSGADQFVGRSMCFELSAGTDSRSCGGGAVACVFMLNVSRRPSSGGQDRWSGASG